LNRGNGPFGAAMSIMVPMLGAVRLMNRRTR
jgi:hypothetical protein